MNYSHRSEQPIFKSGDCAKLLLAMINLWPVLSSSDKEHDDARQAAPQDAPVRVAITELRADECVVHITYNRPDPGVSSHRYLCVKLADMSVTPLADGSCPA